MVDGIITWMVVSTGMPMELAMILLIIGIVVTMPWSLIAMFGIWLCS